ncbi:sensor histidine kinase [Actinophytocola gossypii]|uniref:histidine kinase n=1 Tax=Actinophytocola gossypii TaxID=2812003 RepID=A0ABT2JAZ3_9PSEU|nr:histidine kinase [Actinophytocola gossypii]MCT2585036.1 two-component sensor histidine kinase [Actinophytocola gossypii]
MSSTTAAIRRWAGPRIPQVQAVVLFALGNVILASGLPVMFVLDGDAALAMSHPVRLVTLAVICAAELLRSRAPAVGLVVGVVVFGAELSFGVSLAVVIVFTDLLFAAVLHGSRRTVRVILWSVGVVVLGLVAASVLVAHTWRDAVVVGLQVCCIPLIPVWWAMNVRQHRDMAREQRARADQLTVIAELDRKAAVAAERSRMARDLHDVVAGHLSAIAIQSEAVLSMVDGDRATMRKVLRSVRENSVASLSEMHAMIGLLRADEGETERTAPARLRDIDRLLDSARAAGLDVHIHADAHATVEDGLPAAVDLSAYRIVQEALTNVIKHAPGSRAEVTVGREDANLVVEVTNSLVGTGTPGSGRGLLNMRERAQAVGGVLVAGPADGRWRVRAELPAELERA